MLTDEQIEALRPKIDVCTTWINPDGKGIFDNRIRAMPWTRLIDMPLFASVKDKADKIYCRMRDLGFYCPHIQHFADDCIQMRWAEDKKIITIKVFYSRDRLDITYGYGKASRTISTPARIDDFVDALETLTDELTSYEHGSRSIKRSSRSKMGPDVRDIP